MKNDRRIQIKVCGMTQPGQIQTLSAAGADWLGFVFYDKSPRSAVGLDLGLLANIDARPVGVFVNRDPSVIVSTLLHHGIGTVQLHGGESPQTCAALRDTGLRVWKAVSIATPADFAGLQRFAGTVDRFVFDTKCAGHGGSGKKFDWRLLQNYQLDIPFMLAGGIGPGDAAVALSTDHPQMAGLDINSRFETAPGVKDIQATIDFIKQIKSPLTHIQ